MKKEDADGIEDASHENFRCAMEQHFQDFKEWAKATKDLQNAMSIVVEHTKPLQHIPEILHDGVTEMRLLRESLIVPATSSNKWSVSLAGVLSIIAAMAFCIVILGSLLVIGVSEGGYAKITPTGIEITRPAENSHVH
jgi:hypothetical protein